jgi:hypothetical protein
MLVAQTKMAIKIPTKSQNSTILERENFVIEIKKIHQTEENGH